MNGKEARCADEHSCSQRLEYKHVSKCIQGLPYSGPGVSSSAANADIERPGRFR